MHWVILSLAAIVAAPHVFAAPEPAGNCPKTPRRVLERFISADCEACWSQPQTVAAMPDAWVLDWIVPGSKGDEAPLAAAAPTEARGRVARLAGFMVTSDAPAAKTTVLQSPRGTRLAVAAGPAWRGYFGVQLDIEGRWPKGSVAWLGLVESIPAGTDGTPQPRQLVRTAAGPIAIADTSARQRHNVAMRWPDTAKPERLRAAAWVERADGRIVAFIEDKCLRMP